MGEPNMNQADQIRDALGRIEVSRAAPMPGFEKVWSVVAATASPMDESRWSLARSARVAASLVLAQCRVSSWLVAPVALVSAAFAVLTVRLLSAAEDSSAAASGFVTLILVGAVVTVTMAVSRREADSVSVVTPVGPASVLFARVTMVLIVDCAAGVAASWIATVMGLADALGPLIMAWLAPMVMVTGLGTLLAVWTAPWVGALVGVMTIPVLVPVPEGMMRVGLGSVVGAVNDVLPSFAAVGVGVGLFVIAMLLARRAAVALGTV